MTTKKNSYMIPDCKVTLTSLAVKEAFMNDLSKKGVLDNNDAWEAAYSDETGFLPDEDLWQDTEDDGLQ